MLDAEVIPNRLAQRRERKAMASAAYLRGDIELYVRLMAPRAARRDAQGVSEPRRERQSS